MLNSTFLRVRPTRSQERADLFGPLRARVDPEAVDARQVADELARVLHRLEDAVAIADQDRGLAQAVGVLGRVRDQQIAGIEAPARLIDQGGEALTLGGGEVLAGLEGEREVVAVDDGARVCGWRSARIADQHAEVVLREEDARGPPASAGPRSPATR